MLEKNFTEPQIYGNSIDTEWFIGFKFYCERRQKYIPRQVRLGINYCNTVKSRQVEAENVQKLVAQCLKEGWNPFDCEIKSYIKEVRSELLKLKEEELSRQLTDPRFFGFKDALNWAYNKKTSKDRTLLGLKSCLKFALQASEDLEYCKVPIKEISRFHCRQILDRMVANRQIEYDNSSNKRYKGKKVTPNLFNGYLDRLSNLLFEYEDSGIIDWNPLHKIKKKDEIDFGVHRHPTEKELAIIKAELPKIHPEFYNVARFIFVTGMRPDELLDVKFSMVDNLNSCIRISDNPYNDEGELISKTTAYRQVPLPKFLLEWISERGRGHFDSDYLFSSKFRPGSKRMSGAWISMLWKQLVIDGLGIDVTIYSFKGLGGDAKRKAGIEIDGVSGGYGHTTTKLAKNIYLEKEGERLRNQIIEMTPDL